MLVDELDRRAAHPADTDPDDRSSPWCGLEASGNGCNRQTGGDSAIAFRAERSCRRVRPRDRCPSVYATPSVEGDRLDPAAVAAGTRDPAGSAMTFAACNTASRTLRRQAVSRARDRRNAGVCQRAARVTKGSVQRPHRCLPQRPNAPSHATRNMPARVGTSNRISANSPLADAMALSEAVSASGV